MEDKQSGKEDKILNRFIYAILIIIIILSSMYILKFFRIKQEAVKESELLNSIDIDTTYKNDKDNAEDNTDSKNDENTATNQDENKAEQKNLNERIAKVRKLQEDNKDIVGWIEIENTNINYPVLQGEDNEYYLTHNYKKEKSEKGSIFLTESYNWDRPSDNLLIFGHNIINGLMFQDLLKYSDEDFYELHPTIRFTTKDKDMKFEIFSVFKSRVFYKSEQNVFRYYNFVDANNEKEYDEFVKNAKKSSLYNTNITPKYGDKLITLVTCSYHTTDGRFVVIGKESIDS